MRRGFKLFVDDGWEIYKEDNKEEKTMRWGQGTKEEEETHVNQA